MVRTWPGIEISEGRLPEFWQKALAGSGIRGLDFAPSGQKLRSSLTEVVCRITLSFANVNAICFCI